MSSNPPPTLPSQINTWQIVSGLSRAHAFRGGASYPDPFGVFVQLIELFSLNFFAFFHTECVRRANYNEQLVSLPDSKVTEMYKNFMLIYLEEADEETHPF
mgnify:CR=1 FL=1